MQYKTGTASVTQSSQTVTGTGTTWLANVTPGDGFTIAGSGVPYTVASVETDTSLTLSAPYAGATAIGQVYTVWRDFTTNYSIPELSQGDIETATVWTRGVRKIDGSIVQAVTDHEAKADPHPQYITETVIAERIIAGTAHTLEPADAGAVLLFTSDDPVTLTIERNAVQALPARAVVTVIQEGAGTVTISGAAGVTLPNNGWVTTEQHAAVVLYQREALDHWQSISGGGLPTLEQRLFGGGEQGAWYDPSDLTTLYQDSAGTTPVTADGDPVGLMLDKSGNDNHASQSTSASRPIYRTDGTLHWLEFDGTDDFLHQDSTGAGVVNGISVLCAGSADASGVRGLLSTTENNSLSSGQSVVLFRPCGSTSQIAPSAPAYSFGKPTATPFLVEMHGNLVSGGYEYFDDGASVLSGSSSGSPVEIMNQITIGSSLSTTQRWDGNFYGGIVVARYISGAEQASAREYLATKAGVTL